MEVTYTFDSLESLLSKNSPAIELGGGPGNVINYFFNEKDGCTTAGHNLTIKKLKPSNLRSDLKKHLTPWKSYNTK